MEPPKLELKTNMMIITSVKELMKKLFSKREPSQRDLQLIWVLQTRAWICYSCTSLVRICMMLMGSGAWFWKYKICDGNEEEDQ